MSLYYKEKELSALEGKIKTTIEDSGFFVKNLWKVIGFGLLFSLWAPMYSGGDELRETRSALEVSELNYFELVILSAIVYSFFCFLAHVTWKFQDEKKLKRLRKRKYELEKEIKLN